MLRFTIRDLFWLTLVVALGLGWWLNAWWRVAFRDGYWRLAADCSLALGIVVAWWVDRNRLADFGQVQADRAELAEATLLATQKALGDAVEEIRQLRQDDGPVSLT